MPRLSRAALARLTVIACLYAGVCLLSPSARAQPLLTDDGGRAARFASGWFGAGSHGSSGVVAQALRYVGSGKVTKLPGAWCADFVSLVLRSSGHRPLPNRMAASALAYGPHVHAPRPGDLVVMSTRAGYAHHVGVFVGWERGNVVLVSGNWGRRVARSLVSPRSVNAFVRV